MKQLPGFLAALFLIVLASCSSGGGKKVMVMASGKVAVNGNTVTLSPGSTHNEVTVEPDGDNITVVAPSGTKEFPVKDEGLYLINLKNDTLAGSYQRTGTDNSQIKITEADLWERVDSLNQLMRGTNISEANRNYNLPPFSIARITKNTNAQIIGPFRKLPGSFDPSKKHEVYKFYTNKELVETVEKVRKMLAN